MKRKILALVMDLAVAAALLGGIYGVNYMIPQKGVAAQTLQASASGNEAAEAAENTGNSLDTASGEQNNAAGQSSREQQLQALLDGNRNGLPATKVSLDSTDWRQKFAGKFTDQVVSTDTSYTSPNVSVQLTYGSYQTNRLDRSEKGGHEKYGTIIRNGIIYRAKPTDMETCVLNWDGTMKIYSPQELNTQTLIDSGAYQSWVFGPSLLDENGKARTSFLTWDYIMESHPRTAIGYFEPGHYCLLVVDGRQKSSRGMFPDEMAALFEQLGCQAAYNLDGGHCSFMTMQDQVANHPYKPEHEVQDGIFITEGLI